MEGQAVREYGAYIDGAFRAIGTSTFEARDAASGALLATLSRCGGAEEINDAVEAAGRAFPAWAGLTTEERSAQILQFAALVEERTEELAQLECMDTGRHIREMREDYRAAVSHLRYFASVSLAHHGFGRELASGVSGCETGTIGRVRTDHSLERSRCDDGIQDCSRSRCRKHRRTQT